MPVIAFANSKGSSGKTTSALLLAQALAALKPTALIATEIHERDAFAAVSSMGGTVAGMSPKPVNGLDKALETIEAFRAETIVKLRAIRDAEAGRAA